MKSRGLVLLLWLWTGIQSAAAAETSLEWPYYRVAMQAEALRVVLQQPPQLPWARALNERVGFRLKAGAAEDLAALDPLLELTSARMWTRLKGPPKLPRTVNAPVMRVKIDTCRKTWDQAEPGMGGLHTAISNWPERPTCLLQRFGTSDDLAGSGEEHVDLSLKMVGGRLGAKGRVVGWPGEKEKGFRALYRAEGPIMTLLSAQVRTQMGWSTVMRSAGGSVLLEQPMRRNSKGRIVQVAARLVYAKPRKNGAKWLGIGLLPPPAFPRMLRVFEPVDVVDPLGCEPRPGLTPYGRRDRVRWVGESGVFACTDGQLTPMSPTSLPFVLVQNAGAGVGPTRRAAQVVYHALIAAKGLDADQIEVGQEVEPMMKLDHITVYYRNPQDQALADVIVKNLHLAMPWQVVMSKKVAAMPGRFTVQVGW